MRVPHDSVVLVADGRKMLVFRNAGDAELLDLKVIEAEEHPDLADRDQKSGAAGRAASSHGAANSAVDETDYHQQAEDRFAAAAAEFLKRGALAGEYEQLIIVAPPRTLGELRKHYHVEVEKRLAAELAKDLTGHPVDQIERILLAEA